MNESFGRASELFFDLAHRRWPITYTLSTEELHNITSEKQALVRKITQALKTIVNNDTISNSPKTGKNPSGDLFTIQQNNEFEYLYSRLTKEIILKANFQKFSRDYQQFRVRVEENFSRKYSCQFLTALILFIEHGYVSFNEPEFGRFLSQIMYDNDVFSELEEFSIDIHPQRDNDTLLLRTLGLISANKGKFLAKMYHFIHWIEFNNLKQRTIEFEKI